MEVLSWIPSHPWAWPALEVVHLVGIALLLGPLVLFELRVWGAGAALEAAARCRRKAPAWTARRWWRAPNCRRGATASGMSSSPPSRACRPGDPVALVGYTFSGEKGDAVLRAEYLFVGVKAYGMRSSAA